MALTLHHVNLSAVLAEFNFIHQLIDQENSAAMIRVEILSHGATGNRLWIKALPGVAHNDQKDLLRVALQSRRLGFSGMSLIHPSQIDEVNAAFTPTADEVDYCRRVVQAFDDARARGEGAIAFGGQLLDMPIVDRARQTIALAESLKAAG